MDNASQQTVLCFRAEVPDIGKRLDTFVTEKTDLTRNAVAKCIENENVTVGRQPKPKNYRLRAGDVITVCIPQPKPSETTAQAIPLDIVYEDADLLVINKPCGMVVHPAPGNPDNTLVNALLYHCKDSLSGIGGIVRPGIVHRIDKDTSGLLVVAKNDAAHLFLAEQLKDHRIQRIYYAIALGTIKESEGTVDAPIGRHPTDRKKMAVIHDPSHASKNAVTHWNVLANGTFENQAFSLIRCQLETGRTHQIRVHMASIGHPLLGDPLYGGNRTRFEATHKNRVQGQMLHAGELRFLHPASEKEMEFSSPLPETMQSTVQLLFGESVLSQLPH